MILLTPEVRNAIANKEIVVLSDRYPPKSFGGAEVSLHNALGAADESFRSSVLVVFFDPEFTAPHLYSLAGITILGLPDAAAWPFNSLSRHRHSCRLKNPIYKKVLKYVIPAKDLLKPKYLAARAGAFFLELSAKPSGGVQHDFLVDESDFRAVCLKAVLQATKCRKLVADNTRSIMLGAIAGRHISEKVAIVRDNRFNCARHNQTMMVGENFCGACSFSCAPVDCKRPGFRERIHRMHLELVQRTRSQALASYNDVIVTSHFLARNIRRVLGTNANIHRVPNPAGDFEEIMDYCRGVAEAPRNDILVVGMLNEAKGQLQFVKQAAKWLAANPHVRITFAGRGDRIKRSIEEFTKKNNLQKSIKFANYVGRRDLFTLMKTSKFVLIPVRWKEPFGRVPLEAGLARKAVVSFAVGGICETIIDGKTGVLVEPGNYRSLIEACEALLGDGGLRQELGANAFKHIVENYLHDNTGVPFLNVISGKSNGKQGRMMQSDSDACRPGQAA
ncbi:glycosyl transferase, group 1 [Sinorhizobium meliloti CCNWSX0020]|uniref:Glycosyl transferase, group 1 n=1 Tax=Sinorhizobium meliloti CCNWSX0020 TaxID=1107881 RepID=H0FV88_RHIML|nr:glycosyltransferase family 4 protein [Sinorhizobium meliloti]EHK79133.1 glycosyl transferase, group 1 [Sinorhizobium meliloti CCNWSX0020]RVG63369.1 glycosyltransferase [Sinorhizobium meliloti]